jgi:hypothetical protein
MVLQPGILQNGEMNGVRKISTTPTYEPENMVIPYSKKEN